MTALILAALLAVPCPHPTRSPQAKAAFMRAHPCPGGPDKGSKTRCAGYVVDHVFPLACCGKDAPSNMQWQTVAAGKAKDRTELSCRTRAR
jgi:hypothetical protein